MWRTLTPHPGSETEGNLKIEAIATRHQCDLNVRFLLTGNVEWLDLPEAYHPGDQRRIDELWKTTCFEAFVQPRDDDGYLEVNVAPSGNWAAYRFDRYRHGMKDAVIEHRQFRSDARRRDWYDVSASFRFTGFEGIGKRWRVGLSAVIEALDGTKSYWALAHAPGPPDFHNSDCFIATLPAPNAA